MPPKCFCQRLGPLDSGVERVPALDGCVRVVDETVKAGLFVFVSFIVNSVVFAIASIIHCNSLGELYGSDNLFNTFEEVLVATIWFYPNPGNFKIIAIRLDSIQFIIEIESCRFQVGI